MIANAKKKSKPFDVILVHKFDRFARSREDSVVYKSILKREAGVKVVSISEKLEDDKFSVILEAMLEAMAEYYSLNLSDEVKKGMTEKAHRGGYQTAAPFGYALENKKLVVVPEEAKLVRLIYEKFSAREMGARAIAIYLNDLGIKSKRGNSFEVATVDYILNNPVYIGKVRWTPTEPMRRNYNHPDTIIADSDHEPIITQELWDKAQAVSKENKELFPYRTQKTSTKQTWLHGLVHCSSCDKKLVRTSGAYMQCNGYSKGQCTKSNFVKSSLLEQLVIEALQRDFTTPLEISVAPKPSDNINSSEFDIINTQLEAFESKLDRIAVAYRDGIDTLEEYKNNKAFLNAERERLHIRLNELKETLLSADDEQTIEKRLKDVHELLNDDTIDFDIKSQAAHFLISKITYEKEAKTLKLTYKL